MVGHEHEIRSLVDQRTVPSLLTPTLVATGPAQPPTDAQYARYAEHHNDDGDRGGYRRGARNTSAAFELTTRRDQLTDQSGERAGLFLALDRR